jgi:hypothetical protein
MSLAFEEIFAIANAFQGIPMAGRTDAWILADTAAAHGIPADSPQLARFRETTSAISRRDPEIQPGAKGLDAGRP